MHHRLLVLTKKDEADDSETVRARVYNHMANDATFLNEGGLFASSIADWFVIGGRWSGELSSVLFESPYYDLCKEAVKPAHEFGYSTAETTKPENLSKFQEIWEALGGDGDCPFSRDTYNSHGSNDDAKTLTKRLWDKLIKPMLEDKEHYEVGYHMIKEKDFGEPRVVDIDYDEITTKSIATKWIVVLDYHN